MNLNNKKIVCLGGGIGTVNLIKGLRDYTDNITVVISMADEGGSSGRLRRLYNILPPGDLVSCMAAFVKDNDSLTKLLTYRLPGNRYSKDDRLAGHKIGNLIMVAMRDMTGSFDGAIALFQKTFNVPGVFLPATANHVSISAKTIDGKEIFGEEKIDLGKYKGKRILERVFLHPHDAKAGTGVYQSIMDADVIIAGPGDLYTTILPVLIVPEISNALKKSTAQKIFVVNVANKPFETKNYSFSNYVAAIEKHLGFFPFEKVIVNTNYKNQIPKEFKYTFVKYDNPENRLSTKIDVIREDLVNEDFPIYHSSDKLAKTIAINI